MATVYEGSHEQYWQHCFFWKSRLCGSIGGQSEGKDEEKKQDEANTEGVKCSVEVGSPQGFVSCIVKSKQVRGSM